jgi:hypothetical protein
MLRACDSVSRFQVKAVNDDKVADEAQNTKGTQQALNNY